MDEASNEVPRMAYPSEDEEVAEDGGEEVVRVELEAYVPEQEERNFCDKVWTDGCVGDGWVEVTRGPRCEGCLEKYGCVEPRAEDVELLLRYEMQGDSK